MRLVTPGESKHTCFKGLALLKISAFDKDKANRHIFDH